MSRGRSEPIEGQLNDRPAPEQKMNVDVGSADRMKGTGKAELPSKDASFGDTKEDWVCLAAAALDRSRGGGRSSERDEGLRRTRC